MKSRTSTQSRRDFLRAVSVAGGTLLLPACTKNSQPLLESSVEPPTARSKLPDGLHPGNFIIHSKSPLALETRRSKIGSGLITPASRFFIRNNLPIPSADIVERTDAWVLSVRGVKQARSITLPELQGLGLQTECAVIQCSGNGRAFFAHGPSGSTWKTGAAGCALWTGIRISTLVEYLGGAVANAKFLTATGGEALPQGIDRNTVVVERSIPISKALDDTLLTWEMNGAPIPLTHGGPLRLIVPGYYGCNNIKYVKRLTFAEQETDAAIQRSGYRLRPIGVPGNPDQPSMWRMPVKSWLNGPGADGVPVLAGRVTFYGVALSGERGIRRVEISFDRGNTWVNARIEGPDLGPNAWRAFSYTAELAPGQYTAVSRATDTVGEVQPLHRVENERGYGYNAWLEAALTVNLVDALSETLPNRPEDIRAATKAPVVKKNSVLTPAGENGRVAFSESAQPPCGVCHTLSDAGSQGSVGPNLDQIRPDRRRIESAVTNGVGAMPAYRDVLTPKQIQEIAEYIVEATR